MKSAFFVRRGALSVVLNKQQVDVGFQRGAQGLTNSAHKRLQHYFISRLSLFSKVGYCLDISGFKFQGSIRSAFPKTSIPFGMNFILIQIDYHFILTILNIFLDSDKNKDNQCAGFIATCFK